MVYRGKPSKGCFTCRKRKIKCGQEPDGCSQCRSKNLTCPGYRDQLQLLFQDQTDDVTRKQTAQDQPPVAGPSQAEDDPSAINSQLSIARRAGDSSYAGTSVDLSAFVAWGRGATPIQHSYSFEPTRDEKATGFFYHNYVFDAQSLGSSTNIDDDIFIACVRALGQAGLATFTRNNPLLQEARQSYGRAIQKVNQAIASETHATKDTTILSVLILGMFETVSGTDRQSLLAWTSHIQGAGVLLKLRGAGQLRTPQGQQLFSQVSFSVLTSCLQQEIRVPAWVHELREEASNHVANPYDKIWQLLDMMLSFTDFSADVKREAITDKSLILEKALMFDAKVAASFASIPEYLSYTVVEDSNDPAVVPLGYYHKYPSYWVAQLWNGGRTMRMMLNAIIRSILLESESNEANSRLIQSCEHTLFQIQADLIASVPQHLGYPNYTVPAQPGQDIFTNQPISQEETRNPLLNVISQSAASNLHFYSDTGAYGHSFSTSSRLLPLVRMSGGYSLLWPLFVAHNVPKSSPQICDWIVNIARTIGSRMGVYQAYVLAELMSSRVELSKWFEEEKRNAHWASMD